MTTILDIAREDGEKLARNSVAYRQKVPGRNNKAKTAILDRVSSYFTRMQYRKLYRAQTLRDRGRTPSDRECDLAYREAVEKAELQAEATA